MQKERVLLVNPTKHLGNLLISLGSIQKTCMLLKEQGCEYRLVFDETYQGLLSAVFKEQDLIFYPRKEIETAPFFKKLYLYFKFLCSVWRFAPVFCVDLEADSVSSTVSILSLAKTKIAPYNCRRKAFFTKKASTKSGEHEFYKYHDVLGMVVELERKQPFYGSVFPAPLPDEVAREIRALSKPVIVIHAGATKEKKMWPVTHWVELIELLKKEGGRPVLIGAGESDRQVNQEINGLLSKKIPDLCDLLNLRELGGLLNCVDYYIGNDSGPMHYASAMKVPAIAIFGPTKEALWGPLSRTTKVLRAHPCNPSCNRGHSCDNNFSCLTSLTPKVVMEKYRSSVESNID